MLDLISNKRKILEIINDLNGENSEKLYKYFKEAIRKYIINYVRLKQNYYYLRPIFYSEFFFNLFYFFFFMKY